MESNDKINVGLDFGTHQTKICIQRIPDEGHGEPSYEFFSFEDLNKEKSYFLPSLIQINEDDTLSYGFVDKAIEKSAGEAPTLELLEVPEVDIEKKSQKLFEKYANLGQDEDDKQSLITMLKLKYKQDQQRVEKENEKRRSIYDQALKKYKSELNTFRYFKQATFSLRDWPAKIDSQRLCIWYLAYVIFLIEDKIGNLFSINMGIPTDDNSFDKKKQLAVSVLASAYNLVENVYHNDINAFLKAPIKELMEKTEMIHFSPELIVDYAINVFPEAYAGLLSLTARGKITEGMSLTVDIGGGTTDISFFTIDDRKPCIYKYWSVPLGLNYLAEESGFDYFDHNFEESINENALSTYNQEKTNVIRKLVGFLYGKLSEIGISKKNLSEALKNRAIVYMGGGSSFTSIITELGPFNEIHMLDSSIWKEEQVADKSSVGDLSRLLSISYGLASAKNDDEVKLYSIKNIFGMASNNKKESPQDRYVDKDMC